MFRISYSREYDLDWYRVTCHVIDQTILVHKNELIKVGMDRRCSVGCKDITVYEIIALGFVFPVKDVPMVI